MVDPEPSAAWRRSSRCDSSSCVEVASRDAVITIRNSQHPSDTLSFSRAEWIAFVEGVRAGDFD
jgi:hypothetical protein